MAQSVQQSATGSTAGVRFPAEVKVKGKVKVTLRLTVSQSVCLGVEHKSGTFDHSSFLFQSYCLVFFGAPSLTRSDRGKTFSSS
jgi:hypothetical protein